ncbi:MAG: hypothetical protein P1U32_07805 [Legionellaceae bacterium]|nr:hypothetical protein [Legionellaceae bacterium]
MATIKVIFEFIKNETLHEQLTIEVDENASLQALNVRISEKLNIQAMLLPLSNHALHAKTVGEYCTLVAPLGMRVHMKVVNHNDLSTWEKNILQAIAIPSSETVSFNFDRTIRLLSQTLPQEVKESFLVRFGDIVNMYGRTVWDTVTSSKGRNTLQVHPYAWVRAGASAVIIYKDANDIPHVLLVYNKQRDARRSTDPKKLAGIPSDWKVPEGHLNPKPCASTDTARNGILGVTDKAEELVLSGESVEDAYRRTTPSAPLFSAGESMPRGVLREISEEVGLNYTLSDVHFVHQVDHYKSPMITNIYYINAGKKMTPPQFKIDGIEIANAAWIKCHAFQFDLRKQKPLVFADYYDDEGEKHPVEVTPLYAICLGRAIQTFRANEMQQISPLYINRHNIEAKIKRILASPRLNPEKKTLLDVLGMPPESALKGCDILGDTDAERHENLIALSALGKNASEYHKKIMALARAFNRTSEDTPLNAQQLTLIATEGVDIEARLGRKIFSLFPLMRQTPFETSPRDTAAPSCAL